MEWTVSQLTCIVACRQAEMASSFDPSPIYPSLPRRRRVVDNVFEGPRRLSTLPHAIPNLLRLAVSLLSCGGVTRPSPTYECLYIYQTWLSIC
jgi:hypothetical protein